MSKRILSILLCVMFVMSFAITVSAAEKITYFVSADAAAGGDGSFEAPFGTIEAARDAIRALKKAGNYPEKGVTVYIRGGQYKVTEGFQLTEEDSGTETGPVEYCSYANEDVMLVGGAELSISDFKVSSDSRIRSEAAGKVYSYNLRQNDIQDYGELQVTGHAKYYLYEYGWFDTDGGDPTPLVLFDDETMTLARYPNGEETMTVDQVINPGRYDNLKENPNGTKEGMEFTVSDGRVESWKGIDDVWIWGSWYYDWSEMTTPIASIEGRTIKTEWPQYAFVRTGRPVYVYNLLEELDAPGEWFYDKKTGEFYVYPSNDNRNAKVLLGFSTHTIVNISNAENIIIRGLNIKGTRGMGMHLDNCENVKVICCSISDTANHGMLVRGKNLLIDGCHIDRVGQRGISISGPEIDSNNVISNCIIHNVGTLVQFLMPAIYCSDGTKVRNNLIYDCPQIAIYFGGNFNEITNNEIHDVMKESTDGGAIYSGQNYTFFGNTIKGNVIHDVRYGEGGGHAVYFDDCVSGNLVTENIFYNIGAYAMFNQGGRSNKFTNNIVANSEIAIRFSGFEGSADPRVVWDFMSEADTKNEDYIKYFGDELVNIPYDDPLEPKYGVVKNNICYNVKTPMQVSPGFRPVTIDWMYENNTLEEPVLAKKDIGFLAPEANNFVLSDTTKVLEIFPDFTAVSAKDLSIAQIQLKKHLENSATAFVVGRNGAYVNWERTLIDADDPEIVPFIENGTAYVPLRFFAEGMGSEVGYENGEALIENGADMMRISPNGIFLGEEAVETENGVIIRNDRMFVPIRACGEIFGKQVLWRDSGLIILSDENLEDLMDERMTAALYNRIW